MLHTSAQQFTKRLLQARPNARRGFSFVEILFAVMIMGMGFIMIAVIFPVGVQRTKANFDETQAAAMGRSAFDTLSQSVLAGDFPATGNAVGTPGVMVPMQTQDVNFSSPTSSGITTAISNDAAALLASQNMISTSDPRFAWVPLYRRDLESQVVNGQAANVAGRSMQISMILVNRSTSYSTPETFTINQKTRWLEPRRIALSIDTSQADGPITVGAPQNPSPTGADANISNQYAAASGAFVVVADDRLVSTNAGAMIAVSDSTKAGYPTPNDAPGPADWAFVKGKLNGHVYRLGNESGTNFDFYPGFSLDSEVFTYYSSGTNSYRKVTVQKLGNAQAYVVGRNRRAANGTADDFEGFAQDVAYYTGIVYLK